MSQPATRQPHPSRRLLLGAAFSAPAVAYGPRASSPDAALIADCREFIRQDEQLCALIASHTSFEESEQQDAQVDAAAEGMGRVAARIVRQQARTLDGVQAKAEALLTFDGYATEPDGSAHEDTRLCASLLRDLMALREPAR